MQGFGDGWQLAQRIAQAHHVAGGGYRHPLHHAVDDAFHVTDAFEGFADGVAGQRITHKPGHRVVALADGAEVEERLGNPASQQARPHGGAGLVEHRYQ